MRFPVAFPRAVRQARAVLDDADARARFRQAPMSVEQHHAYAGGALQHTVAVATACRELQLLHPRLDPSVVGAASLLVAAGDQRGQRPILLRAERRGKKLPETLRRALEQGAG